MEGSGAPGRLSERSVIQVGDSALAVTLPSWWARLHGLRARMKVGVEVMADGSLRIVPKGAGAKGPLSRVIRVGEEASEGSVVREVVASYLAGFTRIRVEYPPSLYRRISSLRPVLEETMLGFTLVEEGLGYMEFYVTVDPGFISFWEAVGRAFKATLSMLRDAINAAELGSVESLKGIPERDVLVDRLYLYAGRMVNRVLLGLEPFQTLGLRSLAEAPFLVMAVKSIERVADHTALIAENSARLLSAGRGIPGEVLSMVKESCKAFETSGRALISMSRKAAEKAAEIIDKYQARGMPGATSPLPEAALIIDSARRILAYSLDIAEIVIDLESIRQAMGSLPARGKE
ncbi:PhoU domain-containing protein [Stetteria hydrogenophila]